MKILISGASGMVGSNLVAALLEDARVDKIGFLVRENSLEAYRQNNKCEYIYTGNNFKSVVKDFNPEVVVHLASFLTSASDDFAIENLINSNIKFGTHLLDSLKNTNIELFINVGSFSEYHNNSIEFDPTYLYSATKQAFRDIVKYYSKIGKFKVCHVIPYTIYGSLEQKKKIIDILIDSLENETPTELSAGTQSLDFIHIDDVIGFLLKLLFKKEMLSSEDVFHLGTGVPITIKQLSCLIEEISGKKMNVIWGAKRERERDTKVAFSPVKEYELIEWKPSIDLRTGLVRLIDLKKNI